MTLSTSKIKSDWSAIQTELFSACKDMFSVNPSSGETEQKKDKKSWEDLMSTIIRISAGEKEDEHQFAYDSSNAPSGLKQIVMWPGGKKNELKHILPNVPSYDRFFEPFVGGGSVFMGINADEHYINDFSTSLISLYKNIASSNEEFFHYLEAIDVSMVKAEDFAHRHQDFLTDIYEQFRTDVISEEEMRKAVSEWCDASKVEILGIIGVFASFPCTLVQEVRDYISEWWGKFIRMKNADRTDVDWIHQHIEAAVKGALYRDFRNLFNDKTIGATDKPLHSALMVFMHQFAYSGMFKYDKDGNFNTAYGGIGVMKKRVLTNLKYYRSRRVREHFQNTHIYNCDFEEFLRRTSPGENDFIFLDPPYDCVFTEYDKNEFNRGDHKRLARYLLDDCKAKWMMIINKTDFTYELYNRPGIHIQEYEKKYTCNAKNEKDNVATHLLITNYDVNDCLSAIISKKSEHPLAA